MLPAFLLAAAALAPGAASFPCPAPFVHDGDYVRCRGREKMRLAAIDAPELADSPRCAARRRGVVCDDRRARASRDNLRRLVAAGPLRCNRVDADPAAPGIQWRDRYGRPVVRCRVRRLDVGEQQLRGGFAVRWPRQTP